VSSTAERKRDHLRICLEDDVGSTGGGTGLERLRLRARALPGRDLSDVDLSTDLWGRRLSAPLLISCMTGGVGEAGPVNRALATAAQRHGIALGLGSGRALLEDAATLGSFAVRDVAPDVMLLANLGAVQLRRYGTADCARLVETCEADALVLHLNAVQEAVQAAVGGHHGEDTRFGGLLERIADVCAGLATPVVVKEVGFGMAPEDVTALARAGVAGVDVAGAGGTNWARVEGSRDDNAGALAAAFGDWGWPTAPCVAHARGALDAAGSGAVLVGSGGLRDGVDACKVLCLGADLAGMGRGLLAAGAAGPGAATEAVGVVVEQLRVAAWAVGAGGVGDLTPRRLMDSPMPGPP
jgi:isopentenyl-diphosphate Delta-isomerase